MKRLHGTLVFHHNGIGDYVMSLPALRLLAEHAPRPLHLVHGEGDAAFLYDELAVDTRTPVRCRPGRFAHVFDPDAVPLAQRYDVFVSLPTWTSPALQTLARRTGARTRIGHFSWCSVRPEADPAMHDMLRACSLALALRPGAVIDAHLVPPRLPGHVPGRPARSLAPDARLLVVHADSRPEKSLAWPLLDATLLAFLDDEPGWHVAVLNADAARLPLASARARLHPLAGLPLADAMQLVGQADAFMGVDSCMLHVADLHRLPGLALFGPTRPEQFGFLLTPPQRRVTLCVDGPLAQLDGDALRTGLKRLMRVLH